MQAGLHYMLFHNGLACMQQQHIQVRPRLQLEPKVREPAVAGPGSNADKRAKLQPIAALPNRLQTFQGLSK